MRNNISTSATDQLTASCGHAFGTRRVPGAPYSLGPGHILVSEEEEEDGLHLGWETKDSRETLDEHLEDKTVSCPTCQREAEENAMPYEAWRVLNLIDRFTQDAAAGNCPTGFDLRLILGAWEAAGWPTDDMECRAIKEEADSLDAAPQFADANQVGGMLADARKLAASIGAGLIRPRTGHFALRTAQFAPRLLKGQIGAERGQYGKQSRGVDRRSHISLEPLGLSRRSDAIA